MAVSCGGVWLTEDDGATWRLAGDGLVAEYMPPDRRADPAIQDVHRMTQVPFGPRITCAAQHHNGVFRLDRRRPAVEMVAAAAASAFAGSASQSTRPTRGRRGSPPRPKDECAGTGGREVGREPDPRRRPGTFDVLRAGLPQEHAYDLVYRHALAVDDTGDRVAIGSTTGTGLWVSEDQGDRWAEVPSRLPPVHGSAVRGLIHESEGVAFLLVPTQSVGTGLPPLRGAPR